MPPSAQPLLLAAVAVHAAASQGHAGQRAQAAANPWRWVLRRALQAPLPGLGAAAEEGPPGSEGDTAKRGSLPPLVRRTLCLMNGHCLATTVLQDQNIWQRVLCGLPISGPFANKKTDTQQVGTLIILHVCT